MRQYQPSWNYLTATISGGLSSSQYKAPPSNQTEEERIPAQVAQGYVPRRRTFTGTFHNVSDLHILYYPPSFRGEYLSNRIRLLISPRPLIIPHIHSFCSSKPHPPPSFMQRAASSISISIFHFLNVQPLRPAQKCSFQLKRSPLAFPSSSSSPLLARPSHRYRAHGLAGFAPTV